MAPRPFCRATDTQHRRPIQACQEVKWGFSRAFWVIIDQRQAKIVDRLMKYKAYYTRWRLQYTINESNGGRWPQKRVQSEVDERGVSKERWSPELPELFSVSDAMADGNWQVNFNRRVKSINYKNKRHPTLDVSKAKVKSFSLPQPSTLLS